MNSTISIVKHKQVFGKQGWHAIFSSTNQLGFPYALLFKLARRCRSAYISFGFGHTLCPLRSHGYLFIVIFWSPKTTCLLPVLPISWPENLLWAPFEIPYGPWFFFFILMIEK
jgi:hypothetical protein